MCMLSLDICGMEDDVCLDCLKDDFFSFVFPFECHSVRRVPDPRSLL